MYVVGSLRYPFAVWCIIEQFFLFAYRSEKEGMMMSDDEAGIVRWPLASRISSELRYCKGLGSARLLGSEQME